MLGRKLHGSRAVYGVYASGKNGDGRARRPCGATELEVNQGACAAADPIALHDAHFFGPALELVQVAK